MCLSGLFDLFSRYRSTDTCCKSPEMMRLIYWALVALKPWACILIFPLQIFPCSSKSSRSYRHCSQAVPVCHCRSFFFFNQPWGGTPLDRFAVQPPQWFYWKQFFLRFLENSKRFFLSTTFCFFCFSSFFSKLNSCGLNSTSVCFSYKSVVLLSLSLSENKDNKNNVSLT